MNNRDKTDMPRAERFALWQEMRFGWPASLTIPALRAVQDAWRSSEDLSEQIMAAIAAAKRQGAGVWDDIIRAGVEEAEEADMASRRRAESLREQADKASTEAMRNRLKKTAETEIRRHAETGVTSAWGVER